MSFDLYFCSQDRSTPTVLELKEYFFASNHFQITDTQDSGVQICYQNEATGVYCDFSYSPVDAGELEGCSSSGLSFNLNYMRPSFFAYETMPLVEAFCGRFNLIVEDPQAETVRLAEVSRLIESWRAHNSSAVGALGKEKDIHLHYLPEPQATAWWRYMSIRQGIKDAMTEDIFVPSLMILLSPNRRLFTMTVWPKGISQFFPGCDYICLQREKKRFFGIKEESGLVPYESVMAMVGPLCDDYEFEGLHIKYLNARRAPEAGKLLQGLALPPVELSQYTRISPDGFHDVELRAN
jgi:hypothetical protein